MAGNRRGRIKEHYEGIHKNLDWIINHCDEVCKLIRDDNPKLTEATKGIAKVAQTMDEAAGGIYRTL